MAELVSYGPGRDRVGRGNTMGARGKLSLLGAAAVAAVAILGGAAAFACTNLATLGTSAPTAKAGGAVTVTGSSFAAPAEGAAASPVLIHWNKVGGPVLASLVPDATGAINGSFNVPDSAPGHYVLVATQLDDKGENQFGTPARIAVEVVGPTGESTPAPVTQPATSSSSSDSSSTVPLALVSVLGVAAVAVFAAGLASFQNERSRRDRPALAPTSGTELEQEREPSHRS